MARIWRLLGVAAILLCMAGCAPKKDPAPVKAVSRFVVRVDVDGRHNSQRIQRSYRSQEKMVAVLNCMRLLRSLGPADMDPGMLAGNGFDVRVWYSDGGSGIYRLRSERFLSKDSQDWQVVDERQAQCLPPLLEKMPSDENQL